MGREYGQVYGVSNRIKPWLGNMINRTTRYGKSSANSASCDGTEARSL